MVRPLPPSSEFHPLFRLVMLACDTSRPLCARDPPSVAWISLSLGPSRDVTPAKTDRRSESPFPLHSDPSASSRPPHNPARGSRTARFSRHKHWCTRASTPPPGPGPPGPPSPSPRVSPRTSLRHRRPSTSPRRRTRSRRLRPATRSASFFKARNDERRSSRSARGTPQIPRPFPPPGEPNPPRHPQRTPTRPRTPIRPSPRSRPRPSPGSRPHPLPPSRIPPPHPRPDAAMGSRRRRDPARGVASIHRARDSSTLPRRGPHEHGCLLLHEPPRSDAALVQRNDRLEDRLERAHTELETERAARVQLESALAETRLKLLVFRRAERRAIGAIRDGVRAFANGAGERDGGSGRLYPSTRFARR